MRSRALARTSAVRGSKVCSDVFSYSYGVSHNAVSRSLHSEATSLTHHDERRAPRIERRRVFGVPQKLRSPRRALRAGSNGKYAFRKYVFCKAYFGKGVGSYGKEYSAEIEMHANLFLD